MIYHYHFDFVDETELRSVAEKGARDIIPVKESSSMHFPVDIQKRSEWMTVSGQELRQFSLDEARDDDNNISWVMEIKNVLTLFWSIDRKEILYKKEKNYTPPRLEFWLYHTFFPICLELRDIYKILHVGSVEIDGQPVLFSAPSFGGKSTMIDYFIQKGHTMLSDDTLGVKKAGDEYMAIASYPYHRPYRKNEELGYKVENFSTVAKPIKAVYVLNKLDVSAKVGFREMKGIEKFQALHHSSFIMFEFMKEERFAFFTHMARSVHMYEVNYPHDMKKLPEVYDMIVEHHTIIS